MWAARAGHLPVARLLVEMYQCNVDEEDGEVSGWDRMGSFLIQMDLGPCSVVKCSHHSSMISQALYIRTYVHTYYCTCGVLYVRDCSLL